MAETCECGNEPSGSVKWGEFQPHRTISVKSSNIKVIYTRKNSMASIAPITTQIKITENIAM